MSAAVTSSSAMQCQPQPIVLYKSADSGVAGQIVQGFQIWICESEL